MMRLAIGALAIFTLVVTAGSAAAGFGNKFGELYFSASETERVEYNYDLPAFATFDVFVVVQIDFADDGRPAQNLTNGFKGWEAEFEVPPVVIVTGRTLRPASSLNVGGQDNFVVGTGGNVLPNAAPYSVLKYSMGLFMQVPPTDLVMTMGPSTPTSLPQGPAPAWLEVLQGDVHPFADTWMDNTFIINCTTCVIAVNEESFGSVKARF